MLDGWKNWSNPVIIWKVEETAEFTVGISVKASAGAWGTSDAWNLIKRSDMESEKPVEPDDSSEGEKTVESNKPSEEESNVPETGDFTQSTGVIIIEIFSLCILFSLLAKRKFWNKLCTFWQKYSQR